jgi:hypothetical protein
MENTNNVDNKYSEVFNDILNTPPCNKNIISIIIKAKKTCCEPTWPRIALILQSIISQNKPLLKKECYKGLPDDLPSLRALVWKINLRYLPSDISKWEKQLSKKRKEYIDIKNALALRLKAEIEIFQEIETIKSNESCNENDKNNLELLSKNTDRILLETINKDVNRTHMTFAFFSKPTNSEILLSKEEADKIFFRKRNCTYSDFKQVYMKGENEIEERDNILKKETHADVLERILYIYSKLNKDVSYVQGMNELLAPIYYCYSMDNSLDDLDNEVKCNYVEADSFWCFSLLMNDIKSTFITSKDNDKDGIFAKMLILDKIIEKLDKNVHKLLKDKQIEIEHFAFRWINLLFGQEFIMPDLLRLWDTFFSEKDKFYIVYCFAIALIKYKKKDILKMEQYEIIKELQNCESINIESVIELMMKIKKDKDKKILHIINNTEEFKKEQRK